jgi:integrase
VIRGRSEIFAVNEAVPLLTTAELDPKLELVPVIAIGLFAGLRMSEIKQLDWRNVDFEHRIIDVDETIAKTRQQRNVEMCDLLVAWLTP